MKKIHNHQDLTVADLVELRESQGATVPKFWEPAGVHRLTAYAYEKGRSAPSDAVMRIMYLARCVGLRIDVPFEQLVALARVQGAIAQADGALSFSISHMREALDSLENSQQWLGAIGK